MAFSNGNIIAECQKRSLKDLVSLLQQLPDKSKPAALFCGVLPGDKYLDVDLLRAEPKASNISIRYDIDSIVAKSKSIPTTGPISLYLRVHGDKVLKGKTGLTTKINQKQYIDVGKLPNILLAQFRFSGRFQVYIKVIPIVIY